MIKVKIFWALWLLTLFLVIFNHKAAFADSDDVIRQKIIEESIRSYSGSCPCPYSRDRAGRKCGGRSAYSRPGGKSPACYPEDVTKEMIEEYKAQQ